MNSDTKETIRLAILEKIPDANVIVEPGSGGHFTIQVVSPIFSGKNMVESQRLVYGAIAHLMKGDGEMLEAWTTLTYLASAFPAYTFGHTVLSQSYRNPALLAKMAATLDYLAGAR